MDAKIKNKEGFFATKTILKAMLCALDNPESPSPKQSQAFRKLVGVIVVDTVS